jgi:uncharacterized protein (DUF58 family)
MDFTLLSDLTPFLVGFAIVAVLGVATVAAVTTRFFAENRAVRVRRHEGFFDYYGHLALGR